MFYLDPELERGNARVSLLACSLKPKNEIRPAYDSSRSSESSLRFYNAGPVRCRLLKCLSKFCEPPASAALRCGPASEPLGR